MATETYNVDALKLKFEGENHSAPEWAGIVLAYQSRLLAHPAQSWMLYEPDSFVFSALFFALLSAGKSIILPQNAQPEHLLDVRKHAQASIGCRQITPELESELRAPEVHSLHLGIPANAPIYFFTSGSTGQAKVVQKNYWQLYREVQTLETTFSAQIADSVFLSTVSHQHIYGLLFKLLWPILKRRAVVCQAYEYPEHILNILTHKHWQSVILVASPAFLQRLGLDNVLLSVKGKIKLIFSSGGPLQAGTNMALQQQLECTLTEVYGSTETGGIAWRNRTSLHDEMWHTFHGISVAYQKNSDLLQLSSPYINQLDYCADDRIEIVTSEKFRLLGRADNIVKIEEKRVSLEELQEKLKQHEYVIDAYVLVIGTSRKQLAAVIVLNRAGIQVASELPKHQLNRLFQRYLAKWFEPVVLPKKFRYPSELPYNASGKLSRRELESSFE